MSYFGIDTFLAFRVTGASWRWVIFGHVCDESQELLVGARFVFEHTNQLPWDIPLRACPTFDPTEVPLLPYLKGIPIL